MKAAKLRELEHGLIYQIYPRSFQDSNGDGIGDLQGIISRLDYLKWLGVDGIWISPIHPSPNADFGYDVSDYFSVSHEFGTQDDINLLIQEAHERDIAVLLDMVMCHTSVEHSWFRDHPDRYIWHEGDAPPNNWRSVFGGSSWTKDEVTGRWYLHSFYPEQPMLNWRNPEVLNAFIETMKFWTHKGIDGFRLDAVQFMFVDEQLRDEPLAKKSRLWGATHPDYSIHDHIYTVDLPEIIPILDSLYQSVPEAFFVVEVWAEAHELSRYTENADLAFCFEFTGGPPEIDQLLHTIERGRAEKRLAWALSNHDVSRLASRWPSDWTHLAAMLVMTLPGAAFIYQGDEIGMPDGPQVEPPFDRVGRDPCRYPMQWSPSGGFTTEEPWLPMINKPGISVSEQMDDPNSLLSLYKDLIALRPKFGKSLEDLSIKNSVLSYSRGEYLVVINFDNIERSGLNVTEVVARTCPDTGPTLMKPHSGYIGRR